MTLTPEQAERLFRLAQAWKAQGARSKWSTPESLALWDYVYSLETDVIIDGRRRR